MHFVRLSGLIVILLYTVGHSYIQQVNLLPVQTNHKRAFRSKYSLAKQNKDASLKRLKTDGSIMTSPKSDM